MQPIVIKRDFKNRKETSQVPCGKCLLCLKRRQNAWAFRLQEEEKISLSSAFITLTYDNSKLPFSTNGLMTLNKSDFQKFMKRLRKLTAKYQDESIKYYACGEYGTQTHRPHYHAIMFNLPQFMLKDSSHIFDAWGLGHIDISPCSVATIQYTTKYIMKIQFEDPNPSDDRVKQFSLMSKKMGLNHLTPQMVRYYTENLISHVTLPGGTLTSLPRYFRDKIFSEDEKKLISLEAEQIRKLSFEKLFNSDYHQKYIWKEDLKRIHEKTEKLKRSKL